ncbi:acyltransferase family protein, partial [Novipirellula maiorica]|uniref:acyltransferase family protein n=1 Tax=Novipirellula maiorica TaxID=1265734 RepID=UPI000593664A
MNKKLWQLEALRGAAAIYVVIYHANFFSQSIIAPLFSMGPEAVILFFILSGFVISHSSENRLRLPGGTATYLVHRFRRIYPLFLFSLFFAYSIQCVVHQKLLSIEIYSLVGNLLMMQDLAWMKAGSFCNSYCENAPLWSLSYEWWFYLAFIPVLKIAQRLQYSVALTLSFVGSLSYAFIPSQIGLFAGYFFLWWSGVELARQYRSETKVSFSGQWKTLLGLLLLGAAWSLPVVLAASRGDQLRLGFEPIIQVRHVIAAIAFVSVGIAWYQWRMIGFKQLLGPLRYAAPISYAL